MVLRPRGPARALDASPEDCVVICISTYVRDLGKLDAMVAELKRRGLTRANRSALIRVALDRLDLGAVAADVFGGLRALPHPEGS